MWTAIGTAVLDGWGSTLRLSLVLVIIGALVIAAIAASGGPEVLWLGAAAKMTAEWIRTFT